VDQFASNEEVSAFLKEIKDAGERAASLTHQLLAFSRHQVLAPEVIDLNSVISNLEKMLKRLIGEDITLHTHLDPSLGLVKADPGQIEQVIMNLAVNSRDAMPTGGNFSIETSNVELDEVFARSHLTMEPGSYVLVAVGDTGVGMTPETKAHIFEPFFTTKGKGKGTGLGLATVYGIIKQSGGSIWVYSEPGQGTVFKLYLPVASGEPIVKRDAITSADSASGSETILVVEDEEGVRSMVRLALASAGYKVLESADGESALLICADHGEPIHLLITDVVMPKMSGPLVADKVATLRPGIKVLYMSGYTDDAVVHYGVLRQEMPFIQKPFSPIALRKKVREVLGEQKV
jgi:CheY-like chemotaxis protein